MKINTFLEENAYENHFKSTFHFQSYSFIAVAGGDFKAWYLLINPFFSVIVVKNFFFFLLMKMGLASCYSKNIGWVDSFHLLWYGP